MMIELIGQLVTNKINETGTIISYDDEGRISVDFGSRVVKFQCPKAFADGFLKLEDENLQEKLIDEAKKQAKEISAQKELKARENEERRKKEVSERSTRKEHRDILTRGERFRTHAEALNECFGYNYKHYQMAFKAIDDQYAAWFPSIAKRIEGEYAAADTSNGWLNILCENDSVIYERNVEDNNRNVERDRTWNVFVFCKMDGENDYVFKGLFKSNTVPTEKGFKYELTGIQIDLNTMSVIR